MLFSYPNLENIPGLEHLQLDPKMLHIHFVGRQQRRGAALHDLPLPKHNLPRLEEKKSN